VHNLSTLQRLRVSLLFFQFPLIAKQLFDISGSVEGVESMVMAGDWGGIRPPRNLQRHLNNGGGNDTRVEEVANWLEAPRHRLICLGTDEYPQQLAEIPDPPLVLFVSGNLDLLKLPQLAIVGSRTPTPYGRKVTKLIAEEMAGGGIVITSGMARGIDSGAHIGALDIGGSTIAVLGTGCDQVYPRENKALMEQIARQGLLVSEFPPGVGPAPPNFPQRNRIVTGMSTGTLVIEARLRSGSLISARLAMEQGREVFAVPGSVLSKQSEGCHHLIKEGARLTTNVADIIEELSSSHPELRFEADAGKDPVTKNRSLGAQQDKVLGCLDLEPSGVDKISEQAGMSVTQTLQILVELELAGFINSIAGQYMLSKDWKQN